MVPMAMMMAMTEAPQPAAGTNTPVSSDHPTMTTFATAPMPTNMARNRREPTWRSSVAPAHHRPSMLKKKFRKST